MAVSLSTVAAKDSAGSAIAGGLQAQDKSGAGTGPFTLGHVMIDGVAGTNMAQVTASNAVKVDGSAVTQPVSLSSVAVTNAGTFAVQATLAAGAAAIAKAEDAASADADVGVPAMAIRKATPANTSGTDGDYEMLQVSAGRLWTDSNIRFGGTTPDLGAGTGGSATQRVTIDTGQLGSLGQTTMSASAPVTIPTDQTWKTGMSNRAFVAAFSTLTRPANTTAYSAADSISDNATAGSVTALSATISDTNDDPIFITDIIVNSTDTGLAGKKVRAYLYNSDPTASTGVGGGDNAAFANKKAGYIASFMGWMETGFSDGTVGRLVPTFNETNFTQAGGFIVGKPVSGAKTLYIQYQAVEAFTPSANSTTIIGSARGWQGRAA